MAMVNNKRIAISFSIAFLVIAVVLAWNGVLGDGGSQDSSRANEDSKGKAKIEALRQIDESPDQLLKVVGNTDCPLRITEAKVKEIPGHLFTRLTGKMSEFTTVSSVPEVTLVNTSGQTVTRFFLAIRDPKSQNTRGLVQSDIAIKPGESYTVTRERLAGSEQVMVAGKEGHTRQTLVARQIDSEKSWIEFAARSDLFITVAKIDFESGDGWIIKEGGEVR